MLRGNGVVLRGVVGGLLAFTAAPYLGGGIVRAVERALIFHPLNDHEFRNPTRPRPPEDVFITAEDGVVTHGWYLRHASPGGGGGGGAPRRKLLVYFHGNAGSVANRWAWGVRLMGTGADVLMVDYRGYGRSGGDPDEAGLYKDAAALWEHVTEVEQVAPEDVILYGKSLGGAVAAELAVRRNPGAVVLQSTFTSIPDMAGEVLPFVPRRLVQTQFDTEAKLPRVAAPTLVIHSTADALVPFAHSERNARAAANLHRHLVFHGYDHNGLVAGAGGEIVAAIAAMVKPAQSA